MRKYQLIWETLKEKNTATIAVAKVFHKRLIKAVIKEKYKDVAFKYSTLPSRAVLEIEIKGTAVIFKLKYLKNDSAYMLRKVTVNEL